MSQKLQFQKIISRKIFRTRSREFWKWKFPGFIKQKLVSNFSKFDFLVKLVFCENFLTCGILIWHHQYFEISLNLRN